MRRRATSTASCGWRPVAGLHLRRSQQGWQQRRESLTIRITEVGAFVHRVDVSHDDLSAQLRRAEGRTAQLGDGLPARGKVEVQQMLRGLPRRGACITNGKEVIR